MKFACSKDKIVSALTSVSYAVSGKNTIPALEGVLITAEDGVLSFLGYDLELAISTSMEADIKEEGQIVLTAKILLDMLRKISSERVVISSNERLLTTIQGGLTEYTLLGLPAADFPELPSLETLSELKISKELLRSMISQTLYAVSAATDRPVQAGAKFDLTEDSLCVVGVDGYRLALRQEPMREESPLSFIVPGKSLSELLKLFGTEEETVTIALSSSHVGFSMENYHVLTRQIKGEFIQYRNSIPKECQEVFTVNTKELMDSLERALLLISSNIKSPLKVTFTKEKILLSCSTTLGRVNDEVNCTGYQGDPIDVGFNCRYLLDALRAAGCDKVRMHFNSPLSPLKITPAEGESFIFLVLPVRLNG